MFKSATQSTGCVTNSLRELRFLVEGLFQTFGFKPPRLPKMSSLDEVRKFCTGLAEKNDDHPWSRLDQLSRRQLQTLSHSLFLFRKVIPKPKDDKLKRKYIRKMCEPSVPADPKFLAFLRTETIKLLTEGWDKNYSRFCDNLTLSTSGSLEGKRSVGGSRACNGDINHLIGAAKGKNVLRPDLNATVKVVREDGKDRIVTISSVQQFALRPWHQCLQDFLTKQKWIMSGEARAKKFSGFSKKKGEVFVSGDYESATDNIHIDVYRTVLHAVYASSKNIPHSVYELAMKRSSLILSDKKYKGKQCRGQLMGNFLSFPILCIINYLTFKYHVPRDVPVKINGDDIVFRSTREEFKKWSKGVCVAGLILSPGKTSVDGEYFTLNSALFRGLDRVREVPFVRSKPLFKRPETPQALSAQYRSICPGFSGPQAAIFRKYFLIDKKKMIGLSQRSLSRGLGMYVTKSLLRQTGLYRRERFYLSFDSEADLPSLSEQDPFNLQPKGFTKVSRSDIPKRQWKLAKEISSSFGRACIKTARVKLDPGLVVEPMAPQCRRDLWVAKLQRGTRSFRDLERRFGHFLCPTPFSFPGFDPPVPRQAKESVMLPYTEGSKRRGLGYRTPIEDVA
uniref:RNA dependent RNA polymerase n=1 Tax=Erysiphe necator associated ourmia-like virus 7 TaxID=2689565 RepID=A0A6B9KGY1_9VIRU|nr:RNA dependent RNA polymerase [Erysiphe necator associated ourmia-like virus 7]